MSNRVRNVALWVSLALGCSGAPYEFDDRLPCPTLGAICNTEVATAPAVSEPAIVVPSTTMADGVVSQVAHNNLDIVWFRGRLFFAFRTAPTHFASRQVVMYVVSTAD